MSDPEKGWVVISGVLLCLSRGCDGAAAHVCVPNEALNHCHISIDYKCIFAYHLYSTILV